VTCKLRGVIYQNHLACNTKPERLRTNVAAGAVGGLAASFAMNQFQAAMSAVAESMAGKEREPKGLQEPEREAKGGGDDAIVEAANVISRVVLDHELTQNDKEWARPAVPYAFGTALGAVYGALVTATPVEAVPEWVMERPYGWEPTRSPCHWPACQDTPLKRPYQATSRRAHLTWYLGW
jgi:hypothetical protein